jgi:uncharacterized small protein (DUF1192 family)
MEPEECIAVEMLHAVSQVVQRAHQRLQEREVEIARLNTQLLDTYAARDKWEALYRRYRREVECLAWGGTTCDFKTRGTLCQARGQTAHDPRCPRHSTRPDPFQALEALRDPARLRQLAETTQALQAMAPPASEVTDGP